MVAVCRHSGEECGTGRETHNDGDQLSNHRFLVKQKIPKHLERNEHCQSEHKNVEDLGEDLSCGIRLRHKRSRHHKYLLASVDVKNPRVNFNDLENSVPPEESNDELLDKRGMTTLELLWTRKKSRKPDSLRWSIRTKCTCSTKCLLLNAGREEARRSCKQDGWTSTKARDIEADGLPNSSKDQTAKNGLLQLRQLRHSVH